MIKNMVNKKNYLDAYESLEAAFETPLGKIICKRNKEQVDISSGASMGHYWGETFIGKMKFCEFEDKRILLWLGKISERHGNDSFHSLWYQQHEKTGDSRRDLANAVAMMRYFINDGKPNGFAVAHEDMLLECYKGYRCINTPTASHCLVELNKLPDNWQKDQSQNSSVPIRKVPLKMEFGRIHPGGLDVQNPNTWTGVPLILYNPSIVDYITCAIKS